MPRSTRKQQAECSGSHCCHKHTKAGLPVSCSASVEPPPPPPPPSPPPSMESSSSPLEPSPPALALPKPASVCSSASSSSSSSTSSPNTSSVVSQQTLQDTLYEYVKGLQDAIKVPDPDLAERLLVEIGNALSLPSAVSLIISANGARLMASCVKHFRSTATTTSSSSSSSTSKPSKGTSKLFTANVAESVPVSPPESTSNVDGAPPPSAATVSNESRRKRQRTVGDVEEEGEVAAGHNGEVRLAGDKSRKPVKVKGRSLKVTGSRKVGGASDLRVEDKEMEGSEVAVENGKCWGKECSVKVEDSGIGDLAVKVFEIEDKSGGDTEESGSTEEEDPDSVYSLAKASGMSNVVATACSALDKLLTAALQSKVGVKYKAGNLTMGVGNGKRGKALSAEMYVALTEAFVDMVHVLKDNVVLLSWCLNCLGSILPPGSLERASFESSTLNNLVPAKETLNSDEDPGKVDTVKADATDSKQQATATSHTDQQLFDQKLFQSKALLKLATKYRDHSASSDFTLKIGSKSCSGSYVAAARSLSSGKSNKGMLQSTFCGGIASESTSSSISALAAVAYAATVPMLAEKAVKAVLSAMQSCDIESRSTIAALRALSAHLSSTNSKAACDDAFTFIIAAMREFVFDADMQAESCLALGSLIRAVSSTTGHAAWTAITISMERHRDNLVVQRAGCGALQVLCSRTGLGIPEWRTGKRPLRASKDSDREAGARALISSMSSFPNDVRIQWHGCSTLWTLVHSAGVKSVANMVRDGAVSAVVGAMSVCRMNEMMQQEGCNVIGTMVRTLAENGHDIGLFLSPSGKAKADQEADDKVTDDVFGSTDWWAALAAVVSAMRMFSKSKSLQSNGTFALGCILKGSGEGNNLGSSVADTSQSSDAADPEKKASNGSVQVTVMSSQFPGNDLASNVERISAAVEATMAAMREFSKVETVQVWGCAVLQQAFLAYVHYAKCLGPVSEACSPDSGLKFCQQDSSDNLKSSEDDSGSNVSSASVCLAKFILSQATAAMYMISRTMALSYTNQSGASANQTKSTHSARGKANLCSRSQTATSSLFFSSVRQSWCAALGAIGDVFGYLTRNSEVAIGKGSLVNSDCMDFFRSNKSFFDRDQSSHTDLKSCCDDERSESEDGAQSEKSSLDTGKDSHDENSTQSSDGHRCSSTAWIQWTGFGASQQQAVKDIKAWQEATEAMAKIAEEVGFPLSVKTAILSIRTIFCKLEDAETVIWACHALVSLYLTWENLHLFKPGTEVDREEYKAKIWGDGEAGVRQLVDLAVHWTNQNRLDVTSLALQALYGACVFAATVQEIEKVFALGNSGSEAVLEAMQKALVSGSAQHRRKVVQQACCVLATVCGYSIRAQVAVAVQGGADLILTALDRYNEDNQIQVNGLHALGIDSHAQPAFDAIWNSAISRTGPSGKSNRRKRGNQTSTSVVGLTHIFREGVNCPAFRDTLSAEEAASCLQGKWDSCFERLVLHGTAPIGLFRTALLAAPGCGGPAFAMELLKRLSQSSSSSAELQAHVCFVIGYMAEHNAVLRTSFIDARAMETILSCMSAIYSWKRTVFTEFGILRDGREAHILAQRDDPGNIDSSGDDSLNPVDLRIECAAAWAIAGLAKNQALVLNATIKSLVQALFVALHRYGGLLSMPSPGVRSRKSQPEVCVPARLALARLGVFSVSTNSRTVYLVHEAAETGDMLCLKALTEAGVDVLVTDSEGKNGEWYAEQFGQSQAVQFFKEQVQIQGRKKAREKAKAKTKHNNRKKDASVKQEQDEEHVSEATDTLSTTGFSEVDKVVPEPQCIDDSIDAEEEEKPKELNRMPKNNKKKQRSAKAQNTEPVDSAAMAAVEKQGQIDHLNMTLREAMASGEVEKMESAIKACEPESELVDERLLKQVRGALAKRLKRREKAGVLEDQLTAAIEEASYDKLCEAVVAVEQSSRFATALQDKLQVAKGLLREMESVNKVPEGRNEEIIQQEIIIDDRSEEWIVSQQKNRRRKEKENAVTAIEPVDRDCKSSNNKNKDRVSKPRKQKIKIAPSSGEAPNNYNAVTLPAGNNHVQIYTERRAPLVAGHDLPPLLPTPRTSFRPPAPTRSVIMPPKTAAQQASTSCEHNPITPQLFPSNRGPLVCNTDFGGDYVESPGLSQQPHVYPSSWSSPRSCSSIDDARWGTWPASRASTPVDDHNHGYESSQLGAWPDSPSQDYISTLLATLFPVERLPSSSTTLFSASLGEFPTPRVAECAPPSGLSTLCGPDDSDILCSSLSNGFVRDGGESNGYGYVTGGGESTGYATGLSNGNVRGDRYASRNGYTSLFSEENPSRMTQQQAVVDPGKKSLYSDEHSSTITPTSVEQEQEMMMKASFARVSMQSRLQAALIEASLEDSCCICFDMPKDAALVPCGHRMCKPCAEQIRCIRENCPICNRYIDAVLALYG